MVLRCFLGFILLMSNFSYGTASDFSKFLHQALEEHTGREPTGVKINYHANLMRNEGPLEKHYHRGRPLQAIILTPRGQPSELPTGIVAVGDFPAMLESVGL